MKRFYLLLIGALVGSTLLFAGNPDRQGESGAAQLLMNPWAPSAGLHSLNTSSVYGVEAMRINPAGLSRREGTEVMLGYANYLSGVDISMQAIGVGSRVGENGSIGVSIMALDFGDVPVTTTDQPDGNGALLNLNFINIGLSYSYMFENKVSVGVTLRGVSESTSDVSSFGFAVDAGVQYVTGEDDQFKFGISLRNVGSKMTYGGQGLATASESPDPVDNYNLTLNQRSSGFEMPSMLNIGASYDFLTQSTELHRATLLGNFTSNSFSRDQVGVGLEYAFREQFIARVGYRTDLETDELTEAPLYEGISAGASVIVPLKKGDKSRTLNVSYGWRNTRIYNGTHNIGLSLNI